MNKELKTDTDKQNQILDNIYNMLLQQDRKLSELYYANLLHDTIIGSSWLKDKSFSLHGWAANYSFIYMLYRILDCVKPQHIIEMGMGQTSKLTSQYIDNYNSNTTLDIIENNTEWINIYRPQLAQSDNLKIHQCDLEFFNYENTECCKYKELNTVTVDKKYDLIIVDGPFGGNQQFPRSNILDMIKNGNICDDFIIIFDDSERYGEQNTIAEVKKMFNNKNVKYEIFQRNGIKQQTYITSISKSFIKFL